MILTKVHISYGRQFSSPDHLRTGRTLLVFLLWFFLSSACLLCFTSGDVYAQNNIDSLHNIIDECYKDSLSWERANLTVRRMNSSNANATLPFSKRLVSAAKKDPEKARVCSAFQLLGISYGLSGKYDSSIIAFDSAIMYAEKLKSYSEMMQNYQNKGVTEDFQSKYKAAFKSYLKALDIAQEHNLAKSTIYGSIARTYMHTRDHAGALHYDSLAIEDATARNAHQHTKNLLLGNLASDLRAIKRYDDARRILQKLIRIESKGKYFLANHYEELAVVELSTGNYDEARSAARNARRLFLEAEAKGEMPEIYTLLAKIEFMDRQFSSAQTYAEEAQRLADSLDILNILPDVSEVLARVHLVNKRFDRFHFYDSLHNLYSDSLNLTEQNLVVTELNIQYESERKEKENLLLRANQLTQDAHILRQRYIIAIIALIFIATVMLLFVIRQRNKISKRNNLVLQRKNQAIESQAQKIFLQKQEIEAKNEALRNTIEEVNAMQAQLVHSEKMSSLGQMTAGITNDINNPLNFIAGSAQALKYSHGEFIKSIQQSGAMTTERIDAIGEEASSLFSALDSGIERVSSIVASLNAFAGPQQGEIQTLSVNELLEISLTLLNNQLRHANVDVVWEHDRRASMIPLNSTQITQVFTNIIDNAIYAMLEIKNPQLVIEVTENASVILVTIKDNGAGIPYQIQSRIMEPFFTTKPVGKGTGLGLCVSFGIIEKHNGKLTFTSEPGKGSTFIVELPK
jgi:two-component system, NtrC family, sensor kinase